MTASKLLKYIFYPDKAIKMTKKIEEMKINALTKEQMAGVKGISQEIYKETIVELLKSILNSVTKVEDDRHFEYIRKRPREKWSLSGSSSWSADEREKHKKKKEAIAKNRIEKKEKMQKKKDRIKKKKAQAEKKKKQAKTPNNKEQPKTSNDKKQKKTQNNKEKQKQEDKKKI
jgi:hypothetical protein